MKNNKNNKSFNLNKKSVSALNQEGVNGGRAQCSILVRDTEVCFTKESPCATYNSLCEEN